MLSYRHAFHAGSFADVVKHAILVQVLRHVVRKPKPVYVLDTHAGAGSYGSTRRWRSRPASSGPASAALLAARRRRGPSWWRPISSWSALPIRAASFAATRARRHWRGRCCGRRTGWSWSSCTAPTTRCWPPAPPRAPREQVAQADGLALLVARMPPPERRGVVLIDPSYEIKSRLSTWWRRWPQAHRRFATGTFLLWYPVIERAREPWRCSTTCAPPGSRAQFRLEFGLRPDAPGRGMTAAAGGDQPALDAACGGGDRAALARSRTRC